MKVYKKVIVTLLFCVACSVVIAQSSKDYQPNLPDYSNSKSGINPVPTAPPPPPSPIPIDGGIGFLVVAGLGYGIRLHRKGKS